MVCIVIMGLLILFSWVGYKYVTEGSTVFHNKLEARRKYVKLHKDYFGIKDSGTSLDKRQIYSLTLEELGLGEIQEAVKVCEKEC